MMASYTEDQIIRALESIRADFNGPAWKINAKFWDALRGEEKERTFSKSELLAIAEDDVRKVKIHGLFGVLGKVAATRRELMDLAQKTGFAGSTIILLDKAEKQESFGFGDVVRDANGKFWQRVLNGRWANFGDSMYHDDDAPRRPLARISER